MDWRVLVMSWLTLLAGCVATGRDQAGVKVTAEGQGSKIAEVGTEASLDVEARVTAAVAALEVRIDQMETQFQTTIKGIETRVSARIGGGGDSITAWLYAAIAGAAVLYPLILRPVRKAFERRRRRQKRRRGDAETLRKDQS